MKLLNPTNSLIVFYYLQIALSQEFKCVYTDFPWQKLEFNKITKHDNMVQIMVFILGDHKD